MTQEKPPIEAAEPQTVEAKDQAAQVAEQDRVLTPAAAGDLAETSVASAQLAESAPPEVKAEDEESVASTATLSATATPEKQAEPMQGVGFLGRRGTGPIRTADSPADATAPSAQADKPSAIPPTPPPAPVPPKPGMAENTFRAMSYLGLIFFLIFLLVQTAAGIYFPSAYWSEEQILVEAYEAFVQSGQWLLPPSTEALPASLPGYFWFMGLIDAVPMLPDAFYLPVLTSVSAFVALLGVYVLGLCTGLGNRVSFAAGLILLSSLGFIPLTHWVGPDLLLAGLLALALAFLYKGWVSPCSYWWTGLGFVLTGLGALVGGLPALWIPLVGSCAFIIWRGNFRRAHKLDAVLGFGLLLLCLTGWIGAVILRGGEKAQILQPLREQFLAPLQMLSWPLVDSWWLGLALVGFGLLPWIFIPLFVSWGRVLGNAWTDIKASRKDKSGGAWLWICLTAGLLLAVFTSTATLTPESGLDFSLDVKLLPLAALLLAKALLNLSHTASRLFFLLLALLCLLAGVALTAVGIPVILDMVRGHLPTDLIEVLIACDGLPLLGGILLLSALTLSKLTNRAYPGGALAVFVLLMTMMVQPATLLTVPSLASAGFATHLPKGLGLGVLPGGKVPQIKPATPKVPEQVVEQAPTPPAVTIPPATEAQPVAPEPAQKPAEQTPAEKLEPTPVPAVQAAPETETPPAQVPETKENPAP